MTPAILLLQKNKIPHRLHEYAHDPSAEAFGLEAAEKLRVPPERVFKTLVALAEGGPLDGKMVFALIPSAARLNLKQLAHALHTKRCELADPAAAERTTGYVVGGISALGGKKQLPAVIDSSAQSLETLYVSAGRRGMQLELAPADLAKITRATFAPLTGF